MLPLLHAGWRRGRAVASGLRHPYQVRRLRSVFGSGRACRNSWDFRTTVISATPRARRKALHGTWPRARGGACRGACRGVRRGAGRRDSRPVTRGTHHRATPVCAVPARPRLLLLSHHGHRGRATASPAIYHAQPPNPTFLPHHPLPATPNSPAPAPGCQPNERRTRTQTERNPPSFAANLFSQPVIPPPITLSCQPRDQARSVSRVFRVRCHLVTC
jgi:hypothetical protein